MKTAFLFAGQGAQTLGMARDLYQEYHLVRETFDEASDLLGYDLRQLIDEDEEKLNQTQYTQPAILVTSLAIWRLLLAEGIAPDMVAGLSLGEYAALVASGALTFKEAVTLVTKRGKLMAEAAPVGVGKMVAVMNTDVHVIEEACQKASQKGIVTPANYNTPGQIVIGGEVAAVNEAIELLKGAGVKRLIPLKVSGPFHTALLDSASQGLARELEKVSFKPFTLPLVSNTTAQVMAESEVRALLARQVKEPVRFYESIETLQKLGAERFVEIGPGKVLSGFVKKIVPQANLVQVDDLLSFQTFVKEEKR